MNITFLISLLVLQFAKVLFSVLDGMMLHLSLVLSFIQQVVLSLVAHLGVLNNYALE